MLEETSVEAIMTSPVRTLFQGTTVGEAAELLSEWGVSGAPIVDAEMKFIGSFSLSDLAAHWSRQWRAEKQADPKRLRSLETRDGSAAHFLDSRCRDAPISLFQPPGAYTVFPGAKVREVVRLFARQEVHRVFVLSGARVIGIVTTLDIMKWLDRASPRGGEGGGRNTPHSVSIPGEQESPDR